jgi:drug/metabolite transporter (DMT)-like permease
MCVVAANDGMVAVLARRMSSIHFSVMMYWFALLGLIFTSTSLVVKAVIAGALPSIFSYSAEQYMSLTMTGICSSTNLTCLTIAFQSDKSTTVSLLAYIELVYAFMADVLIFNSTFT